MPTLILLLRVLDLNIQFWYTNFVFKLLFNIDIFYLIFIIKIIMFYQYSFGF